MPIIFTAKSGALAGAGTPTLALPGLAFAHSMNSRRPPFSPTSFTFTPSTSGLIATIDTGAKSLAGSKPGVRTVRGIIDTVWLFVRNSVLPSGAAPLSATAAIWPPAPGRFSTTTGRLSSVVSSAARLRAMVSMLPPAGNPTRIFSGASWADAVAASGPRAAAASTTGRVRIRVRRFMLLDLLGGGGGRTCRTGSAMPRSGVRIDYEALGAPIVTW